MSTSVLKSFAGFALFLFIVSISGCKKEGKKENSIEPAYELIIPEGFPQPEIPTDNQLTRERIALGKMLFFDPILSADSSISCGSCHNPAIAFSDMSSLSMGVDGQMGTRNTMPLMNLAWFNSFMWDGGIPSLELQVLAPVTNHLEMNLPLEEAISRLKKHPVYPSLFKKAYDRDPDDFSLFRAIAAYERTLISGNSKYDQYFYQKKEIFSESEINGMNLFFSDRLHCASCHSGINFTNGSFQNTGLYVVYPDQGRYLITGDESDKGKFKVPTLRNVELTAPYMHDGSIATLEEVLEHYLRGGKFNTNKSPHVHYHEESLNDQEKKDVINFLKTLTDTSFVNANTKR
ncbi:MAG: c-type cytochrome [Sporocytophaga sp.]|uniref:cytochrome-c peroxidase n=1 Tax=Sporocytophaga sp. TaxID=2231183 RepID=UPI001B1DE89B|nr:cytochrome c peroxidase [Sporocytophaga sp.]MBO9699137.1 c-type cytochrome [Sporocytophaga sp.]